MTTPCMTAPDFQVSSLVAEWPDPRPDGVTEISPELSAHLLALLTNVADYIEAQYARCGH